ncbi:hypothetical protein VNI00_016467 [Paramarasmius palmivorus]|uniref:Uncharacterized protein n=1 Tax=Paramarasmius palmivorus TaxID=297713 RepID=A0AAW0BCQ9_9AGAR
MKVEITRTFASPRLPRPPKVIPLFATAVPLRQSRHVPSIQQYLHEKPRYHPYRGRSSRPANAADDDSSPSSSISASSPTEAIDRDSPLTDDSNDELDQLQPQVIWVKQPSGFKLANSGWDPSLIKSLRKTGKEAIQKYLKIGLNLSDQNRSALNDAREMLLEEFPDFRQHSNFWGADAVLRDQLKNMRDAHNARLRKQG